MSRTLYHFVHSHGLVADAAYKAWRKIHNWKEDLRPKSRLQHPDPITGLYEMTRINIATTAICNAKCVFCIHHLLGEPTDTMSNEMFDEVISNWSKFSPGSQVNLTPGTPPGEPLADPGFAYKLKRLYTIGLRAYFTTNGILLNKYTETILSYGEVGVAISFPSFSRDVYSEVYGVDRCEIVTKNIFHLLERNRALGEPATIMICFRNKETPSEIMKHPNYNRLMSYFSDKVNCMFTTWWDNWNGGVPKEKMERGEIKVRKPHNLDRVCKGALEFSIRPTDRLIRLCGCRYVVGLKGKDDLVVGDLDEGFKAAQVRAFEIQDDFHRGIRQKTCQSCGAYNQA